MKSSSYDEEEGGSESPGTADDSMMMYPYPLQKQLSRRTSESVQIDQRMKHSSAFSRWVRALPKEEQDMLINNLKELEDNLQTMSIDAEEPKEGIESVQLHRADSFVSKGVNHQNQNDERQNESSVTAPSLPTIEGSKHGGKTGNRSKKYISKNPYSQSMRNGNNTEGCPNDGVTPTLLKIGTALKCVMKNPGFPYDLSFRGDSEMLGPELLREELWNLLNLQLSAMEIQQLMHRFDAKGTGYLDIVELFVWSLGTQDKRKRFDKVMKPKKSKQTGMTDSYEEEGSDAEIMKGVDIKLAKAAFETIRLSRTHVLNPSREPFLGLDEFLALLGDVEVLLSSREADLLCMKYFAPNTDAIDATQFTEDFINAGKRLARDEMQNRALESFKSAVHTTSASVINMIARRCDNDDQQDNASSSVQNCPRHLGIITPKSSVQKSLKPRVLPVSSECSSAGKDKNQKAKHAGASTILPQIATKKGTGVLPGTQGVSHREDKHKVASLALNKGSHERNERSHGLAHGISHTAADGRPNSTYNREAKVKRTSRLLTRESLKQQSKAQTSSTAKPP